MCAVIITLSMGVGSLPEIARSFEDYFMLLIKHYMKQNNWAEIGLKLLKRI
jgi:hypothetical protein